MSKKRKEPKAPKRRPIGFRLPGKRKPPRKRPEPEGHMIVYGLHYAWPVEEDL